MNNLGLMKYFMGVEVEQSAKGIFFINKNMPQMF
jgi:hypothetical protein